MDIEDQVKVIVAALKTSNIAPLWEQRVKAFHGANKLRDSVVKSYFNILLENITLIHEVARIPFVTFPVANMSVFSQEVNGKYLMGTQRPEITEFLIKNKEGYLQDAEVLDVGVGSRFSAIAASRMIDNFFTTVWHPYQKKDRKYAVEMVLSFIWNNSVALVETDYFENIDFKKYKMMMITRHEKDYEDDFVDLIINAKKQNLKVIYFPQDFSDNAQLIITEAGLKARRTGNSNKLLDIMQTIRYKPYEICEL